MKKIILTILFMIYMVSMVSTVHGAAISDKSIGGIIDALGGATTTVLVGGGTTPDAPVWTTATGTGAPVRAIAPAITGAATIEDLTFSKTLKTFQGSDVASANDMTLGDGNFFDITGTTTINTIASKGVGTMVVLRFDGILQLTHSNDLFLPTAANVTTAVGDLAAFYEYASGDWRCLDYTRADGSAFSAIKLATARAIGGVSFDGTAAITPTTIVVADTEDATTFVGLWNSATGNLLPKTDETLTYVANTGILTATGFAGPLTGNVTGDATGSSGTCSGLAATATALATTRAIYGNNFDGTAALTQVIASTYGGTGNGFTKFTGPTTAEKTFTLPDSSQTLLYSGGALGTPSGGTLTNCTGLPVGGITGVLPTANGGTGIAYFTAAGPSAARVYTFPDAAATILYSGGALGTPSGGTLTSCTELPIASGVSGLGTNVATFLATPTTANFAGAVTGETGSGAVVFATSPVFTTDIRPSADGATDIGTTALGFGDTYIADDKKIYLGSDQDFSMEYDEDGNDSAAFDGTDISFNATAGLTQFGTAAGAAQVNITPTTAIDALFIKTQEAAGATDGIKITDSGDVEIFAVDSDGNVEATSFTADHMVVSTKTDSYVVTSADFGKSLRMNSADDKSFTLPSVGTTEDGARVTFIKQGAGKMTMIAVDTDYIDDSSATGTIYTITNYATITLEYVHGMTRWVIISAAGTFTTT